MPGLAHISEIVAILLARGHVDHLLFYTDIKVGRRATETSNGNTLRNWAIRPLFLKYPPFVKRDIQHLRNAVMCENVGYMLIDCYDSIYPGIHALLSNAFILVRSAHFLQERVQVPPLGVRIVQAVDTGLS